MLFFNQFITSQRIMKKYQIFLNKNHLKISKLLFHKINKKKSTRLLQTQKTNDPSFRNTD